MTSTAPVKDKIESTSMYHMLYILFLAYTVNSRYVESIWTRNLVRLNRKFEISGAN